MRIYQLENSAMTYTWGSADGLSRALGVPNPSGKPLAELWMGAHARAPSLLIMPGGKKALDEFIRGDPEGSLGTGICLERFGPRLPFLFKALSAAMPLSIQVHPAKRKAERGYEKERETGIPDDAFNRNYRDANHKPELSVALTPFEALCGFRPVADIISNMRLVSPDMHKRYFGRLERSPGKIELSVFFYALMTIASGEAQKSILDATTKRIRQLLGEAQAPDALIKSLQWVLRLTELWPGDIGALMPLIFNHVEFEVGEAVFIPPGEPHAYLGGTALEIMANSDNVLRGALTDKYRDIPEFISVLSFEAGPPVKVRPESQGDGEELFPCPVEDFSLSKVSIMNTFSRRVLGPEIILCGEGQFTLDSEGTTLVLRRGESAFVCADAKTWTAAGSGVIWRAGVNLTRRSEGAKPR